jgi:microcystin-dependent protein
MFPSHLTPAMPPRARPANAPAAAMAVSTAAPLSQPFTARAPGPAGIGIRPMAVSPACWVTGGTAGGSQPVPLCHPHLGVLFIIAPESLFPSRP